MSNEMGLKVIEPSLFHTDKENICVMFSGGYDSTLLLREAVKLKRANKIKDVYPIYINCKQFPNIEKQKAHAEDIVYYFGLENNFVSIDLSLNRNNNKVEKIAIPQLMIMIPACLLYIPNHTDIWFGLIENETVGCSKTYEKQKTLSSVISLLSNSFISDVDDISVRCPYLEMNTFQTQKKAFIIKELLNSIELFDKCFSCDSDILHGDPIKQCNCNKCRELSDALLHIYLDLYNLSLSCEHDIRCIGIEEKDSDLYKYCNESLLSAKAKMKDIKTIMKYRFPTMYEGLCNFGK